MNRTCSPVFDLALTFSPSINHISPPRTKSDMSSSSTTSSSSASSPPSSTSPPPTRPLSFALFPSLPFEIRLKIYSHVNSTPRTVAISYKSVFHPAPKRNGAAGAGTGTAAASQRDATTQSSGNGSETARVTITLNDENVVDNDANPRDVRARGPGRVGGRRGGGPGAGAGSGSGPGRGSGGRSGSGSSTRSSFTSRWISTTPVPALLHTSRETRQEALKAYKMCFASLEAPASIYFNFAVDTLHFVGDGVQEAYRLDMFLGGDYYGCRDAEKVRFLAVDIPEEIYGRRAFCWADVRGFTGVREVLLLIREEEDEVIRGPGGLDQGGTRRERLMAFYHKSLRRVWDAYVQGEGEGMAEGEWEVPEIRVWNAESGRSWGSVKLEI